jgi:Uma2 family endonuclease
MAQTAQSVPSAYIYEMVDGQPIYYRGYQEGVYGQDSHEASMGSSFWQSDIITQVVIFLGKKVSDQYKILTNEVGIQCAANSWRAADIAIVSSEALKRQRDRHKYLEIAPEVVIEIDTKADPEQVPDALNYVHQKTDQLLAFGVKKIIWIFTSSEKVMVAEAGSPWQTLSWEQDIHVIEQISVTISTLVSR